MLEQLKDLFAFFYKRFTWGYEFISKGVAIFNFVGIIAILLGNLARSYIVVPVLLVVGFIGCIILGYVMYDLLGFKTKFTKQEGFRDDYWTHQLSPIQQKMLLVYLEAINNPKKLKELKAKVESGKL